MMKVLIVDDDHLVRKGLIFSMPWSKYNMKVVGEAGNGKKALEFLEKEEVHLIITDLNMPVMSGIELMRLARQRYPKVSIAVLTLHQDFEIIQDALRLGVIDFITKVELETEKLDQVLERLYQRVNQEQPEASPGTNEAYFQTDTGFSLFFANEQQQQEWMKLAVKKNCHVQQMDQTICFCTPAQGIEVEEIRQELYRECTGKSGIVPLEVYGIKGRFSNHVYRLLLDYKEKLLFYIGEHHTHIPRKSLGDMEKENRVSLRDISILKKKLFSFQWVYEDEQFCANLSEWEGLRLSSDHLYPIIFDMVDEWNKRYPFIPLAHIERRVEFKQWSEVKKWLAHFRDVIKMTAGNEYAGDVVNSILLALKLIQDKLSEGLTADEAAKRVNMSRSYFNKCFKDIVGKSFHQYLREIRIEKAMYMIVQTNESLQWIAEQIGYLDEKYFSKIFREQTGFLPSEYRKKHRNGDKRLK